MSAPESLQRLRENGKGAVKHPKTTPKRAKISAVLAQPTGIPLRENRIDVARLKRRFSGCP